MSSFLKLFVCLVSYAIVHLTKKKRTKPAFFIRFLCSFSENKYNNAVVRCLPGSCLLHVVLTLHQDRIVAASSLVGLLSSLSVLLNGSHKQKGILNISEEKVK